LVRAGHVPAIVQVLPQQGGDGFGDVEPGGAERGTDVLEAGRVHVDLWVAAQRDCGAEASTVRRRLSALSSFYRYCAAHDLVDRIPTAGVARPVVDPDYTATVGPDRDEARALVAAADADRGRRRCGRRR
jgi:integrase/recombinase XerD